MTCNEEIKNNITYFVSSNFPALLPQDVTSCGIKINPVSPDISQLRLDFMHFALVSIFVGNGMNNFPHSNALKLVG